MALEIGIVAVFGLVFGSFLNVCISRLPQDESIVTPGSHCPNCNTPISWYDNLPLLSWLLLKGKCRNCKNPIRWRYPLVELANTILWIGCWVMFFVLNTTLPAPLAAAQAISKAFLAFMLLGLAVMDWETFTLPDEFTWGGLGVGVIFQALWSLLTATSTRQTINELIWICARTAIAAGVILLIRWVYEKIRHREGLGLGDAKLIAMLAAWLDLKQTLLVFFIGVLAGALFAVILTISNRDAETKWSEIPLPFGSFLCIAGIYALFFGSAPVQWYESLF